MSIDAKKYLEKKLGKLTFGKLLRAIREADEYSQKEFAEMIGISAQYLSDIEHSRKSVSAYKAYEIAKTLGYSPDQFMSLAVKDGLEEKGIKMKNVTIEAA